MSTTDADSERIERWREIVRQEVQRARTGLFGDMNLPPVSTQGDIDEDADSERL